MTFTLVVIIWSIATKTTMQPTSFFEVHNIPNVKACMEKWDEAHHMGINPNLQEVRATCYPTDTWEQMKAAANK